jgi:hypothetical protein
VAPFDFSVDPAKGHSFLGGNPAKLTNAFWYNQIGNVGMVGYSGAFSLADTKPYMEEACAWLQEQQQTGQVRDQGCVAFKGVHDAIARLLPCLTF